MTNKVTIDEPKTPEDREPRPGDLYRSDVSGIIYLVIQKDGALIFCDPSDGIILTRVPTINSRFRRLPPGTKLTIEIGEDE